MEEQGVGLKAVHKTLENPAQEVKPIKRQFLHYSTAFHHNQDLLQELTERASLGFHNLEHHKKSLKSRTIEIFLEWVDADVDKQRQFLNDDDRHMQALMDLVNNLSSDTFLMEFLLSTLDGILSLEPLVLEDIRKDMQLNRNSTLIRFVKTLDNLLSILEPMQQRPIILECLVGLLSKIYGAVGTQEKRLDFLNHLIHLRDHDYNVDLSDLGYCRSLVHLLKHQGIAEDYIRNGSWNQLQQVINSQQNDEQTIYHCFLNIFLLSYVKSFMKLLLDPHQGILRRIIELIMAVHRDKVIRVSYRIFLKVSEEAQGLSLLIDLGLRELTEGIGKDVLKDDELKQLMSKMQEAMLNYDVKDHSAFQKYQRQVLSQSLHDGPLHSAAFIEQNAVKFEQNDFQIVRLLKTMLKSEHIRNIMLACNDLGLFARFYPNGRKLLSTFGIKDIVMRLARNHQLKAVREKALLALNYILLEQSVK